MSAQPLHYPMRYERILVASDGSEFSAAAVDVAIGMAARCGHRLRVIRVVLTNTNPELAAVSQQLTEQAEQAALADLQQIKRQAEARQVDVSAVLRYGPRPTPEILAEAQGWGADLIVVGRRGQRGLARMMVGQATGKLIAQAPCHVLVVPRHSRLWQSRILLATDGSRAAEAATALIEHLAPRARVPVTVVTVIKPDYTAAHREAANQLLEQVRARLSAAGVECDSVLTDGQPAEQIVSVAAARGADMIVIGRHDRYGLDKLLQPDVAERVVGLARCPVLVARCMSAAYA